MASAVTAVIVAGGRGTRMNAGRNKVFLKLCGEEILTHSVRAFENNKEIDEIIAVTGEDDIDFCGALLKNFKKVRAVLKGGKTRQESVCNGISAAGGDIILIHDGARPLVTDDEITRVIADCKEYGAAALGVKVKDTLKSAENGFITGTIDRERAYLIQTPQAFRADIIRRALKNADKYGLDFTDDCGAVEAIGVKIKITEGSYENIKLTTPDDMITAEKIILKRRNG